MVDGRAVALSLLADNRQVHTIYHIIVYETTATGGIISPSSSSRHSSLTLLVLVLSWSDLDSVVKRKLLAEHKERLAGVPARECPQGANPDALA